MGNTFRNIILRSQIASDIEDKIRWMNVETAWMLADPPWNTPNSINPDELRAEMEEMLEYTHGSGMYPRLEIVTSGINIEFVCAYPFSFCETGVRTDGNREFAVGIGIFEPSFWSRGLGTEALAAWTANCLRKAFLRLVDLVPLPCYTYSYLEQ